MDALRVGRQQRLQSETRVRVGAVGRLRHAQERTQLARSVRCGRNATINYAIDDITAAHRTNGDAAATSRVCLHLQRAQLKITATDLGA